MSILVFQVATFTDDVFGGNPAFVVAFDGEPPDTELLTRICRQLAQPMIAVLGKTADALRLRTITPKGAHPGAGHTTHAAAWVAFHRLLPGASEIDLALDDGGVRKLRRDGDLTGVDWPVMTFDATDRRSELSDCLGRTPEGTYEARFGALAPDLSKVAALDCSTVIVTAAGGSSDFVIRVFAPKEGLPEDPVCGTAHRLLTPLWAKKFGRTKLVSHQLSERRGELFCELRGDTVSISGKAAVALDGRFAFEP